MSNEHLPNLEQHFPSVWTAVVAEWTSADPDDPNNTFPVISKTQQSLLRQIKPVALVNSQIAVFTAPNHWAKEEIENKLAHLIRQVLENSLGRRIVTAFSEEQPQPEQSQLNQQHTEPLQHQQSQQSQHLQSQSGSGGWDRLPLGNEQAEQEFSTPAQSTPVSPAPHPEAAQSSFADSPTARTEQEVSPASQQADPYPARSAAHSFGQQATAPQVAVEYPQLNPDYTFERFVIGSSNQFAAAACRSVAEQPAKSFNPLFLWGESGLGKTHLLHAIAHYALEIRPNMRVLYVSTEELTNEFINAIATDTREAFKRRYRNVDMLIVDDIQFLEKKESTQEEFFHTFNALHQAGKQIVLSSDRPPARLSTLEDRLRTRFEGGLITDIQSPDLETRMAILTNKAKQERTNLPEDVKTMIAERYDRSIRALQGALTRVIAYCSLENKDINMTNAKIALQDIMPDEIEVTPEIIIEIVADFFNITTEEILSKKRSRNIAFPRHIALYLSRELTEFSYPELGRIFARDHSTMVSSFKLIEKQLPEDKELFNHVQELLSRVKSRSRN